MKLPGSIGFLDIPPIRLFTGRCQLFQGLREFPEGTGGFRHSVSLASFGCIVPEHFGKLEVRYPGFAVHQNPGGGGRSSI